MKSGKKLICIVLVLILISLLFASCGSSSNDKAAYNAEAFGLAEEAIDTDINLKSDYSSTDNSESTPIADRKLVKNADLSVQTENFDKFISEFESSVSKLNGYIEISSISGNNYYYSSFRNANIKARIPADRLDEFLNLVSNMATVNSKQVSVNDITSTYIDTESRLKALETEQATLLGLLEKATNVSDIIEVQSRLSEVNGQLESYKSQLKSFDKQVAYSTITLYVDEVERVTNSEKVGFFGEIKNRFSDNIYNIGQGLREFAIWFISSIPYIAIFALLIIIAIVVIRKIIRNRKAKRSKTN